MSVEGKKLGTSWKYGDEIAVWFQAGILLITVVLSLTRSNIADAILFGVLLLLVVVRRLRKGSLIKPPIFEITPEQILIRGIDAEHRIEIQDLAEVRFAGPHGARRWRFVSKTGEMREICPRLWGAREAKAIELVRSEWGSLVRIVEDDPPSLMSRIRGDY